MTEDGTTGEVCTTTAGSTGIGIGFGAEAAFAGGRGETGIQGGSGTEVLQAASKINGAATVSSPGCKRRGEAAAQVVKSKGIMWPSFFLC